LQNFACKLCWKEYLTCKIKEGTSCLLTKCPNSNCKIIVDETLVISIVEKNEKEKYEKYLTRSFIDDNPHVKWCPAPNCGNAVFCSDLEVSSVLCSCSFKFCFKCSNEAHEPCSCKNLLEWLQKEKDDSETINWLCVNTKTCPKCSKAIEKNGGCNCMTCSSCKFQFCWLCLDDWIKTHTDHFKCNKYKQGDKGETKNEGADKARLELEKYNFYYTS